MEAFVPYGSPLAAYLEGQGHGDHAELGTNDQVSLPSTPAKDDFAPRGQPQIRSKARHHMPPSLRLKIPAQANVGAIRTKCSVALNATFGHAENERFLERFRYMIIASQLLSTYSMGQAGTGFTDDAGIGAEASQQPGSFNVNGAMMTAISAFVIAWLISWAKGKGGSRLSKGRMVVVVCVAGPVALILYTYFRRQWLQYLRQQTLKHTSTFLFRSHDFDGVAMSTMSLVQEVEVVSRGYKISNPLPPISRLEDRSQTRRCARLRKAVRNSFAELIPRYLHTFAVLKPLVDATDLERYYDIYDLNAMDMSEAHLGFSLTEFDDPEALRNLKILSSRFHTIRKLVLCCLLALDAYGGSRDIVRWSAALEEIQALDSMTTDIESRLRKLLEEEQTFPVPPTPRLPLTPGRERWHVQMRKLSSLSSGIRGLQAKIHVAREEIDATLHHGDDAAVVGTSVLLQYESISTDLKALMHESEAARATLGASLEKTDKRLSTTSTVMSPTSSLGGTTAVDDGVASESHRSSVDAYSARSSRDFSGSDAEEIFEAIALPRLVRSTLTREERIEKMREERLKRSSMVERMEANTHMLRELQTVIKLRPRGRTSPTKRVTSL